ncbi:1087_t:CDS:2 [Funneliformis mosseae]|uniref:1087_t:CDS:1 n=1 Tax=Funneliformis mosseae TaxID=27381 RepID=A0A9N9ETM1_FUNMO|nr:1087_t:CDS:2 [Funneliformis mosseae]
MTKSQIIGTIEIVKDEWKVFDFNENLIKGYEILRCSQPEDSFPLLTHTFDSDNIKVCQIQSTWDDVNSIDAAGLYPCSLKSDIGI